jgi:adenosylcobinamide-phosphate synthase
MRFRSTCHPCPTPLGFPRKCTFDDARIRLGNRSLYPRGGLSSLPTPILDPVPIRNSAAARPDADGRGGAPAHVLVIPAGLALGVLADALLGDPRRNHPVAVFGSVATGIERRVYSPSRTAGVGHLLACLTLVGIPGVLVQYATRSRPVLRTGLFAAAAWTVLGGRSLTLAADAVGDAVLRNDLPAARSALPSLCGRDPQHLDGRGLVRATVESVAENTSDAVVAPLLWGMVAGIPGLLLYRAVNTLDAMVGHRSPRYADFGTPAARLDDVANWIPARLTALITAVVSPGIGGSPGGAFAVWRRDAAAHPSPNAGRPEAAFAGALGVRLGGPIRYSYGAEARPVLGHGREVVVGDVSRAVRLSRAVTVGALLLGVLVRIGWELR